MESTPEIPYALVQRSQLIGERFRSGKKHFHGFPAPYYQCTKPRAGEGFEQQGHICLSGWNC